MISKRIAARKDGRSSARDSLRYGEGLKVDRKTGELLDKSHRTRFGNYGLIDDGVYAGRTITEMAELIDLAALEMQSNCDLNMHVGCDKKLAHFVVSFNQEKPSEAVLRDTEDSMLAALKLENNHFATFLHDDNGYWHLHIFASRIEKEKPHRGKALWQDKTIRDKVCRSVEIRNGLFRDNGMHKINELGQIVEIPKEERIANREAKPASITNKARVKEIYSGEKSFQTWVNEIRLGDRLKHAKSWQALHSAADAYGCEVKPKGAGFVVCPIGQKGGIQLSKIGLKNLPTKFGEFAPAKLGNKVQPETAYKPAPTQEKAVSHYEKWKTAKAEFSPVKFDQKNAQRELHKNDRSNLSLKQKNEIAKIQKEVKGQGIFEAVSVAKMNHVIELAELNERFARERKALNNRLAASGPGNTFRDFLVIEAGKGDNTALTLARKYGVDETTEVLRKRSAEKLHISATITGTEHLPSRRLNFTHYVDRSGSIVFDLGRGRVLVDSSISKQIQLNATAATDPESIATALRFAAAKFGNTLTLSGSPKFQKLAVETAVQKGLFVKFSDPALDAYREKLVAEQQQKFTALPKHKLTPQQIAKGAEHVIRSSFDKGIPPDHILRAALIERDAAGALPKGSGRLHELPAGGVDGDHQSAELLLPGAVQSDVGDFGTRQDADMRRPGTSATGGGRAGSVSGDKTTGELQAAAKSASTGRVFFPVNPAVAADLAVDLDSSSAVNQQAQRAAAPAAEALDPEAAQITVTPIELSAVPQIPTPLLPAADWIAAQGKPEKQEPVVWHPGAVEFTVLHVSDFVVINMGREVAQLPIQPGMDLRPGMRVVVSKDGSFALAPERPGHEHGRAGR